MLHLDRPWGLILQRTLLALCCHLQLGPHDSCPQTLLYRHYNRSRLGFVNVELLGPRALGHIEHSCPGVGPLPVSTGLPTGPPKVENFQS
jgi:hypothetical protein